MRTDKERLDWIAVNGQAVRDWDNGWKNLLSWSGNKNQRKKSIRIQIDALMDSASPVPAAFGFVTLGARL